MDISENEFTLKQPRKRRISESEFKKAEEALVAWRIITVIGAIILAVISAIFCEGLFLKRPEDLCMLGPMLVMLGLLRWINLRANYLQQLIFDYESQQQ
jgi:hypothetical protein